MTLYDHSVGYLVVSTFTVVKYSNIESKNRFRLFVLSRTHANF